MTCRLYLVKFIFSDLFGFYGRPSSTSSKATLTVISAGTGLVKPLTWTIAFLPFSISTSIVLLKIYTLLLDYGFGISTLKINVPFWDLVIVELISFGLTVS